MFFFLPDGAILQLWPIKQILALFLCSAYCIANWINNAAIIVCVCVCVCVFVIFQR